MRTGIALLTIAILVGACGGNGDEAATRPDTELPAATSTEAPPAPGDPVTTTTMTSGTTATVVPSEPGAPTSIMGGMERLVEIAKADLAARLGVDAASITVVTAEAVTWPDGSLGCPQPGMSYTQVMVDGARIVLAVGGEEYAYHSGGNRSPFLCVQKG